MQTELQKTWEEKINRAKEIKKAWKDEFKVDMGTAYFEGRQNPGYPEGEWLTLNKIYSHIQSQLPSLYSVDPYFYIKLKKTFTPDQAEIEEYNRKGHIRQGLLNYLKGELELKPKARMAIQDAHFAFGVLKGRYSTTLKDNPEKGEPVKDDEGNELKDENGEPIINPDEIPVGDQFHTSRIHFDDFLFDEDAGPLEESWSWLAENIKMTRAAAEKDKRFKKSKLDKVKAVKQDEKKQSLLSKWLSESTQKKDDDLLSFWEIYDLKNKEWLIIAENSDDVMVKPSPLSPGVESHPYAILRFTLRDNSPYPIPPVYPALDPQKEFNLSRSRMLTHRKRFNRKYTVIRSMLEDPDAEMDKLESGDDGTLISALAHGAIEPIKDAPLDNQNYTEISLLNNDIVEAFGTPDPARGVASADSATEAGIMENRLNIREGDRMSLVVDFITTWGRKMDQLLVANLTKDMAVKVTGPQGEFWVDVKSEDLDEIDGEYEYSVNVGASQPRLPDIERAQWMAFMSQVIIPFPHVLTAPNFMKRMAEMFHIEDEAALEELRQIGTKMMTGQMPMAGNNGSQPAENNPAAAIMGSALGALGGNNNGGGSQL